MEAGGGGASSPYLLEPIDMARLLGPLGLLQGVSTQQQHCFPPWKESVPDAALVGPMVDKLKQQLADALAPVATQATEAAPLRLTPLVQLAGSPHVDDPRWRQLDRLVTRVLARFALHADGSRACKCGRFQEAAGSPGEGRDGDSATHALMDGQWRLAHTGQGQGQGRWAHTARDLRGTQSKASMTWGHLAAQRVMRSPTTQVRRRAGRCRRRDCWWGCAGAGLHAVP